jgi:hypothetical protein
MGLIKWAVVPTWSPGEARRRPDAVGDDLSMHADDVTDANQPKLKWPTWMFRRHGYVYLLPSQGIS